jgi:NAD(P)-dependent dehydrogenase (short-subunit alcohol dehydrogenase family)
MSVSFQGTSVFITGATNGIGRLAARALADLGVRLIVHGRDPLKVEATVRELSSSAGGVPGGSVPGGSVPGGSVRGLVADFASLEQVAHLARAVIELEPELDVLINNAGVGFGKDRSLRELSHDGFELRFAVNFLAPFLLTERLLAVGVPRRALLNVASIGQEPLDFSDLMSEREYSSTSAYRRSKLALIAWSFELARSHPALSVQALHPGTLLDTGMVRESGVEPHGPAHVGSDAILALLRHALGGGASGLYFDVQAPARAKPEAYDVALQAELRRHAEALTHPFRAR